MIDIHFNFFEKESKKKITFSLIKNWTCTGTGRCEGVVLIHLRKERKSRDTKIS